jgi:hypothetical protein
MDGSVTGPVLQAGVVHGDVHFHVGRRRMASARRWLSRRWWLVAVAVLLVVAVVGTYFLWPEDTSGADMRDPIRIVDLSDPFTPGFSYDTAWVASMPLEADHVAAAKSSDDMTQLMKSNGGVPLGRASMGVIFRGVLNDPVVITQIKARIMDTVAAPSGTIIGPPAVGGPGAKYVLTFDLDEIDPVARIPGLPGEPGKRFSDGNYFQVDKGETYVFALYGLARSKHAYRWVIDMDFLVDSRHRTLTLGQDEPFVVSGPASTYQRYYGYTRPDVPNPLLATAREVCGGDDCAADPGKWSTVKR